MRSSEGIDDWGLDWRFSSVADCHEWQVPGSPMRARHLRKYPIDHADVEVNTLVQAGVESVDESHRANVQGCVVHIRRTGAVGSRQIMGRLPSASTHALVTMRDCSASGGKHTITQIKAKQTLQQPHSIAIVSEPGLGNVLLRVAGSIRS